MTGNFKITFDGIVAEDNLKANTLLYLQSEIQKRKKARNCNSVRRFAVAFTSVAVILLSGIFTHNLYFAPSAYVDVDINPSIELTLNRLDRIIDVYAYNEDGMYILLELSLKHKNYEDALMILIEAINRKGYIQNNGLVSVTLQTDNTSKEHELLSNIQTGIAGLMAGHHNTARIDVFSVNEATRSHAHELNISPAKYLAIQELIEVDPTATVESGRSHSISEIRQMTWEHEGNHHGTGSGSAGNNDETGDNENYDPHDGDVQGFQQNNSHHGRDHE